MSKRLDVARQVLQKAEEQKQKPRPDMVCTEDGLVSYVSARMLDPDWGSCEYLAGRKVSNEREGYIRYYCLICQTEYEAPQLKPLDDSSDWTHICPRCARKYVILRSTQEPADFPYVPERR